MQDSKPESGNAAAIDAAQGALDAAQNKYKDAGCADNSAKEGCDELKKALDIAQENLDNAKEVPVVNTAHEEGIKNAKQEVDKAKEAYAENGCDVDSSKEGCAELKQKVDSAQDRLDNLEAGGADSSASTMMVSAITLLLAVTTLFLA